MTDTPLTEQQLAHWKRRALQAEAAASLALWMRPLTPGGRRQITGDPETAEELCQRLRQNVESLHPHLIVRHEHQKIEVFQIADGCGCDPNADDYDDEHSESSDEGEDLCTKRRLGFICDSCRSEDGDGPAWKPYAVEWPCPPIAALDQTPAETAAPAPTPAPLAASQPPQAPAEGETATRAATGLTADRVRALAILEAANFLRDAHYRDGLTVQEIGTALRNTADQADPMVGSYARDGYGLDEIADMLRNPAPAAAAGSAGGVQ